MLDNNNNLLVMEPENKSELLNNHFYSIFITDDHITVSLSYSDILKNVSETIDLEITVDKVTMATHFWIHQFPKPVITSLLCF